MKIIPEFCFALSYLHHLRLTSGDYQIPGSQDGAIPLPPHSQAKDNGKEAAAKPERFAWVPASDTTVPPCLLGSAFAESGTIVQPMAKDHPELMGELGTQTGRLQPGRRMKPGLPVLGTHSLLRQENQLLRMCLWPCSLVTPPCPLCPPSFNTYVRKSLSCTMICRWCESVPLP